MLNIKYQNDLLTSERLFISEQLCTAQAFGGIRARVSINSQDKGQIPSQTKQRVLFVNLRLYMFGYPIKKINYFSISLIIGVSNLILFRE